MRTQDTIRTLNRLIRACRDGEEFCELCGDAVQSPDLGSILRYRAQEWGRQGDELQALVLLLDGEPATAGGATALVLRTWLLARAVVLGPSDVAVLDHWRRLHERALDAYEDAIGGYLPERIRRTLSLQADRVAERLEHIERVCAQRGAQPHGAESV
jgi:uncharacterized protein (TIGR02284 family)